MEQKSETTHKIKKYVNRKLYDQTDKRYVSLEQIAELIKAGENVIIEDNKTGEDITSSVVSKVLAREKEGAETGVPAGILFQLLRKGRGTVSGYVRRYAGLWQSALTMAEDEIDKLVKLLVKEKEITESEGSRLKKEMLGYAENYKSWIGDKIDQRINEVMGMMNLATRDQVITLTEKIESLTETVERLEKKQVEETAKKKKAKPASKPRTSGAAASSEASL
jgi:polyhydroxyalkanoate synthesis repressor PhaR